MAYECDISDRHSVNSVMAEFVAVAGRLDVLVNNAVVFHYAPLVDMPEDIVQRMLAVGVAGTIWSLQAAMPHLVASGVALSSTCRRSLFRSRSRTLRCTPRSKVRSMP